MRGSRARAMLECRASTHGLPLSCTRVCVCSRVHMYMCVHTHTPHQTASLLRVGIIVDGSNPST